MTIIHTSDWRLGHRLHNCDRIEVGVVTRGESRQQWREMEQWD